MNKKKLTIWCLTLLSLLLVCGPAVLAQQPTTQINLPETTYAQSNINIMDTASTLINSIMALLGIVAVVLILIGGFQWMTAGGNSEKVDKAKATITNGAIGLVIIFAAWGIARFVINLLGNATP